MMNWLLGLFFFFFFRKVKKPRFLPMVWSVGRKGGRRTWSRTVWQQELQLHNRFPVNCFMYRFWQAAFWVTLPLPSQAKRAVCRQGISMCLSQWFPSGREMRRGSGRDLLASLNPDNPNCRGEERTLLQTGLSHWQEAETECVEGSRCQVLQPLKPPSWLQPLRQTLKAAAVHPSWWRQEERMGTCFHQL